MYCSSSWKQRSRKGISLTMQNYVMWQITKERAVQFLVAWINDGRPNSRLFISRYLTFLLRHGPLFYILATASALDKVALAEGGAVRLANSTFGSSIWLWVVPLSLRLSCVARKKTARKKWPRELLGPQDFTRLSFLAVFFHVTQDELSECGTIRICNRLFCITLYNFKIEPSNHNGSRLRNWMFKLTDIQQIESLSSSLSNCCEFLNSVQVCFAHVTKSSSLNVVFHILFQLRG